MRVLVGGIIGAVASAAAWFFLEYTIGHEMGWLAILVGIITGLCINAAAGPGASESYARGALAVVLTMVAMVGGRFVYAKVMQNVSQVTTLAPAAQPADGAAADAAAQAEQGTGEAAEAEADRQAQAPRSGSGNVRVRLPKPTASTYEDINFVWMAVAALASYFTGKGSGKAAPVVSEPTMPEGTAGTPA